MTKILNDKNLEANLLTNNQWNH